MKDDYTSNSHYLTHSSLKGWENALFELQSERVNQLPRSVILDRTVSDAAPKGAYADREIGLKLRFKRTMPSASRLAVTHVVHSTHKW